MGYKLYRGVEEDLEAVFFEGLHRWGEERARIFIYELYERFQWLSENPEVAPIREDLSPPRYRSWRQAPYIIFYVIKAHDIYILAVVHEKRDIGKVVRPRM